MVVLIVNVPSHSISVILFWVKTTLLQTIKNGGNEVLALLSTFGVLVTQVCQVLSNNDFI